MNKKIEIFLMLGIAFVLIISGFVQISQSAPPPEEYTEYFYSDKSVYVSESSPNTNYNTGSERYYLMVGEGYEFLYNYYSYVEFSPIDLPEDADIQEAEIGLYLPSDPENVPVKMYYIRQPWVESTVTYNTRPLHKIWSFKYNKYLGLIDEITISSTGWNYWDATSVVEDWVEGTISNYGVAFESLEGEDYRFYSDDSSNYKPRLIITYLSLGGEPPEEPPEEPPDDTTPCEISYTVTPESPESGDTVTIEVTATDDIAMEYISIYKGGVEVEACYAEGTQTTLECSYSEVLYAPGETFSIFADDKGAEPAQGETFTIDVTGSGTPPVVTMDIEFRDENAIPEWHRLLPGDNQMINITVTASDPDGINLITISTSTSSPQDYSINPPQTEVTRTLRVANDDIEDREFTFYTRAYDTEGRSTRVDGEDIEIRVPYQWYYGFNFSNWGCDENHTWSWEMMEYIFGEDDVWWEKGWGWKRPRAERLYDNKVKTGGRKGHCYGMCVASLEMSQAPSRIYPNYIQDTAITINDLERENWNYTWRYYYARQAGQYSENKQDEQSDQYWDQYGLSTTTSSGLHPHMEDVLNDIIDDLNNGDNGVLGIRGPGGHAVIPWRVLPSEDGGITKVYIYDPNRAHASYHDSTDYKNTNHYPFIEVNVDSYYDGWWSYVWNSTSTWDEFIYYYSYDCVLGDKSEINYLGPVGITDQRLPSSAQITAMGDGDITFYAEDSLGRKTGIVDGVLNTEIPYSLPIFEMADSNGDVDMYILPSNMTLKYHIQSTIDSDVEIGNYSFLLFDNSSMFSVDEASCAKGSEDSIILTPDSNYNGHSFRFKGDDIGSVRGNDPVDCKITIAKEFYNSPKLIGREYSFTSESDGNGKDFELTVTDDYEGIEVVNFGNPIDFSIITKSTESFENEPDIDYIPQSQGDFSLNKNKSVTLSPKSWNTTSQNAAVTELGAEKSENGTPGFGLVIVLIGIIIIMFLVRKRK
jgi:hypothetical protein